jgi:hypothetical protein
MTDLTNEEEMQPESAIGANHEVSYIVSCPPDNIHLFDLHSQFDGIYRHFLSPGDGLGKLTKHITLKGQ